METWFTWVYICGNNKKQECFVRYTSDLDSYKYVLIMDINQGEYTAVLYCTSHHQKGQSQVHLV